MPVYGIDRPPPPEEPNVVAVPVSRGNWGDSLANVADTIARAPAGQQLAIGGLGGWCLGYAFMKVGKTVAVTVGSGLIILQVASYYGYVQVDWPKANNQMIRWRQRLQRELGIAKDPTTAEKVFQFVKDHVYLAGGLAGGFILGMGSA